VISKIKSTAISGIFVMFLLLPFGSAFAYDGGLLDGKRFTGAKGDFVYSNNGNVTDGSETTSLTLNKHNGSSFASVVFNFDNEVDIDSFYASGSFNDLRINFFDSSNTFIKWIEIDSLESVQELSSVISDVASISIENTSYSNASVINELDFFGFSDDITPPGNVGSLTATGLDESAKLTWDNPSDTDLNKIFIEDGNGVEVYSDILAPFESSTTITGLTNDESYNFTVYTQDDSGNTSSGTSVSVTPFKEVPLTDVKDLTAKTDYNRVDLSWKLPESPEFKHVNIYREQVVEEPGLFKSLFLGTIVSAAEEDSKIFETNGTYFNDFTVEPEKTYEYTLTSEGTDGEETDGVTVKATTLEEPTPEMGEVEQETTPEGDYLYKWTSPTEGQVKLLISGEEYKTVNAEDGQILIPKKDMKFTAMGEPDVSLKPISKYGTIGEEDDLSSGFEGIEMPFGPVELLKSGTGLLMVLGSIVLLSISFLVVPRLRKVIFEAIKRKRSET
jgi:hypothetical protein